MSLHIGQRKESSVTAPVTVMDLSGRIVVGDAADGLWAAAKQLIDAGERNLLFNLEKVSYLDSAGLGALMKCHNALEASHGRMKLLHVPANIHDLLRITKLLTFFEIFDNESAAVKSYS